MSITMLRVGNTHPMWIPQSLPGAVFNDDIGMFVIGMTKPELRNVAAFEDRGKFGIMCHRRISVMSLIIGDVIDVSVPYHASLVDRDTPPSPVIGSDHRLLSFCLVDAPTGTIIDMRASTISPHLTKVLDKTVRAQIASPISEEDFIGDARDWTRAYPTARSVRLASTFSKLGA